MLLPKWAPRWTEIFFVHVYLQFHMVHESQPFSLSDNHTQIVNIHNIREMQEVFIETGVVV